MPPSMLESMLGHVEAGYTKNGNPYHNNMHACDVLQTTHYFISQTGLAVRSFFFFHLLAARNVYAMDIRSGPCTAIY
jgi:hypothetical protein